MATTPVPYTRFTASGTLGLASAPFEIFSYSLAVGHDGDVLSDAQVATISNAIRDFHIDPATRIHTSARLKLVKAAHRAVSGTQDDATRQTVYDAPGGSTGTPHPSQITYAVSLRGPASVHPVRGRFYIPAPCIDYDQDTGLGSQALCLGLANRAVVLMNAIRAVAPTVYPAIASPKGVVQVGEVRVGRVADTLRSRRNAINEAYVVAATALTA